MLTEPGWPLEIGSVGINKRKEMCQKFKSIIIVSYLNNRKTKCISHKQKIFGF